MREASDEGPGGLTADAPPTPPEVGIQTPTSSLGTLVGGWPFGRIENTPTSHLTRAAPQLPRVIS